MVEGREVYLLSANHPRGADAGQDSDHGATKERGSVEHL
jgi:hypothetical protein